MEQIRLAPLVGIAGSLAVVAALAYPYVAGDGGVGAYYGSGVINPLVAGLLAIVTVIILAAGREGRTDPEFAAGA
ncbi:MAG: putative membrane protein, partial [Haloarculaceae archaeon]